MKNLTGRIQSLERRLCKSKEQIRKDQASSKELRRQIEAGRERAGYRPWWRPYPQSRSPAPPPGPINFREEILKGRFRAQELEAAWEEAGRPDDWSSRGPWPESD